MNRLEDKTYRQRLIARYLDAETSSEEEAALANFYRQADVSQLTEEDLDIRNLMLAIESYEPENNKMEEGTNEMEEGTNEMEEFSEKIVGKKEKTAEKKETSWVRLSALLLVAAMITGLIFLVFPVKNLFAPKPTLSALVPTTQVVRSQQPLDEDDPSDIGERMEREDSLFRIATRNVATSRELTAKAEKQLAKAKEAASEAAKAKAASTKEAAEAKAASTKETAEDAKDAKEEDFNHIYEIASLALPSAEQLTIDRQGDNIVITTTDEQGKPQQYAIDLSESQNGQYQIHPLAQLNEY